MLLVNSWELQFFFFNKGSQSPVVGTVVTRLNVKTIQIDVRSKITFSRWDKSQSSGAWVLNSLISSFFLERSLEIFFHKLKEWLSSFNKTATKQEIGPLTIQILTLQQDVACEAISTMPLHSISTNKSKLPEWQLFRNNWIMVVPNIPYAISHRPANNYLHSKYPIVYR